MTIAYLMQVHKNSEQIKSLIACLLNDRKHHCFVHVDKKSEDLYQTLRKMYAHHEQVYIIEARVAVNWSGFSQVEATLSLMRSVHYSNRRFDRIQLMSGEDFPVKDDDYICTFLEQHRNKEFIAHEAIGRYRWRLKQYNVFTEYQNNRTFLIRLIQRVLREIQNLWHERRTLEHLLLYKGSSWFNISIEAMEYILNYIDTHKDFLDQFNYTVCADEHFFQIILLNSVFKKNMVNHNLYYLEWEKGKNSPNYLSKQTLQQLNRVPDILFARKVDEDLTLELSRACR